MESSTLDAAQSRPDPQSDSPSEAVVHAVAAAAGVDATELPPLFDAIDPDALDALFASGPASARSAGTIRFTYAGHEVLVQADGEVRLEPVPQR